MRLGHLTDAEIQELLDRQSRGIAPRLSDSAARSHLQWCAVCRETAEDYEALGSVIVACSVPDLSSDFTPRLVERLPQLKVAWRTPVSTIAAVFSPIAAVITLLLGVDIRLLLTQAGIFVLRHYFLLTDWWDRLVIPTPSIPKVPLDWSWVKSLMVAVREIPTAGILIPLICVSLLMLAWLDTLTLESTHRRV